MDYPALRSELLVDPVTLGYAGKTDQQAADLLNSLTTNRSRPRTTVTKNEVIRAIRNVDYPTTSAQDQIRWNKLNFLMFSDTIDASNQNIKDTFTAIFTGTPTLAALNAIGSETISRATELNLGMVVALDVNRARSGVW